MTKKDGRQIRVAYIVLDKIGGGELFDYVLNSGAFTVPQARYYLLQLLKGIHFVHSAGFAHRDLKPENIMLDDNYNLKIVDFGFASAIEGRDGSGFNETELGSPAYMAPEIF